MGRARNREQLGRPLNQPEGNGPRAVEVGSVGRLRSRQDSASATSLGLRRRRTIRYTTAAITAAITA